MRRAANAASRASVAVLAGLILLAVLRWPPVWARPLLDVRALSLAGPAVVLAVVAALTGRVRPRRPVRGIVLAAARRPGPARGRGLPAAGGRPGRGRVRSARADRLFGGRRRRRGRARPRASPADAQVDAALGGAAALAAVGRVSPWVSGRGEAVVSSMATWCSRGRGTRCGLAPTCRSRPGRIRSRWCYADRPRPPPSVDGPGLAVTAVPADTTRSCCRETWPHHRARMVVGDGRPGVMAGALLALLVWRLPWDAPRFVRRVARHARRDRMVDGRPRRCRRPYELAAGDRSRAPGHDGPARRAPQRLDPGLGRACAGAGALDASSRRPIFHPLPDTLAFSENLLLPAILPRPRSAWADPCWPTTSPCF